MAWAVGIVLACVFGAGIQLFRQVGSYKKETVRPVGFGLAFWDGTNLIAILFGALMLSFGASDIFREFGIAPSLVTIINQLANIGAFIGSTVAAQHGTVHRRVRPMLATAGVVIFVPTIVPPAFGQVTFALTTSICMLVFGALAGYGYCVHTRVLVNVRENLRGTAMGIIVGFCLLVGVIIGGIPLAGVWRPGVWAVALTFVLLAVTYPRLKGAPAPAPAQPRSLRFVFGLALRHWRLITGVGANFSGWVAIYTIPSLAGVSAIGMAILASIAQLFAAYITPWVGRQSDRDRRLVGRVTACVMVFSLLAVSMSLTWPALQVPLQIPPIEALSAGLLLCGLFFMLGEGAGNGLLSLFEAELSLAGGDDVRLQLIALAMRHLIVGLVNITLAVVSGMLEGVVSGSAVGVALGVVSAVIVGFGVYVPLRKM